ncbi:PBECR2 nuclease fold domain-containing protein [Paracoccus sp. (in: a-proteobacteria)]|uniref:PBECR2 nuclease fold domain-containing protein n=1 Tax=Paracoccus sp. TaxID=267 RepID=UPI0032209C24
MQAPRLDKAGPDPAPEIIRQPYMHEATGVTVDQPEDTSYGRDYMPGDLWERGLVPSALIEEGGGLVHAGRHALIVDEPAPLADLMASARPFAAAPLAEGLAPADYVRAFLQRFGTDLGRAVLWQNQTGTCLPISDGFFPDRAGMWKVGKRGREVFTPLMAETLLDPDEIWLGVARKTDPIDQDSEELVIDRRYIRADLDTGMVVIMEVGRRWWEPVTAYNPTAKNGKPNL